MKRNTLTTAVLAGLTGVAGMAGVANAVNVNPDGLGQVLLYPYYTARGGNDTLISIVNTTERGKAVKIRFMEALNSREVLDFNIYMSPYDVWTAGVTATADGGAKMVTGDSTCTAPYFYDADTGVGEQAFLSYEYAGDGGPQGIERSASGYIEVIEMHSMLAGPGSNDPSNPGYVHWGSKHVAGQPRDCDTLVSYWAPGSAFAPWRDGGAGLDFGFDTELGASGGLFGAGSVINVADGTMFSYNATAIDGFWAAGSSNHTNPSSLLPDLGSGDNVVSNLFINGAVASHDWTFGATDTSAVNAVLTYNMLMNEYAISDDLTGHSEWVLTFPTKRWHTDADGGYVLPNEPVPPFTRTWHVLPSGALNHSCEDMAFRVWDREETEPTDPVGDVIVSPPPPDETPDLFQLCREANVVRFSNAPGELPAESEIMKEPLRDDFPRLSYVNFQLPGYQDGWMQYDLGTVAAASPVPFSERLSEPAGNGEMLRGLPVIGFWASTYTNGDVGGLLSNYGGSFDHRGSRMIVVSGD